MNIRFKFILFVVLLGIFFPKPVSAENLLQNGDFESGILEPWVASGGTATISSEQKEGAYSMQVNNDSPSSFGFQQTILGIEGGKNYQASGYGMAPTNSNTVAYFLRIAWYESIDGTGSQLSTFDSNVSERIDGGWAWLELSKTAPNNARSAKLRAVLASTGEGISASAYFDNISFQELVPTSTPIPTSTTVPTPILTHTPTPTRVNTSTPTPSPTTTPVSTNTTTPTAKPTSTSSIKPSATKIPTPTDGFETFQETPAVLGESTTVENTPTPTTVKSSSSNNLPKIFIGTGALFLVISGGLFIYLNVKH